jgi:hypothetical protein
MRIDEKRSGNEILRLIEDIVWASDRAFFEQQPTRQFRIRPAWNFEIEDFALHHGEEFFPTPAQGHCWWIVVRQVRPGFRARYPFTGPHTLPCEAPEEHARGIWFRVSPSKVNEALEKTGLMYDKAERTK